jgi:hypothetical protein
MDFNAICIDHLLSFEGALNKYVFDYIWFWRHNLAMSWSVVFCDEFDAEFQSMAEGLQDELLVHALLLREFGPNLGRPTVDTLKGSRFPNMKELRFSWEREVWRVAFAFDPARKAILLAGGDKGAGSGFLP